MRETLYAVLMVGFAFAAPLAFALIIVASDQNISYAVGSDDGAYTRDYAEDDHPDD